MRIASLAPSVTEILYELGAQNEIVASTIFCDWPVEANHLPKVGSWVNIDFEKLRAVEPEIVFTSSAVQGKITTELKNRGFKAVNINPATLSEVVESYNQIGGLVGKSFAAGACANELYKQIMGSYLLPHHKPLRVYTEEWSNPPMAGGSWVPELVGLAGGLAGIGRPGSLSRVFELSELLAFDPEVIVLHICGLGDSIDPDVVYGRTGWENISAVKNRRVYAIHDSLLNRPTSRLFLGLAKLREIFESVRPVSTPPSPTLERAG